MNQEAFAPGNDEIRALLASRPVIALIGASSKPTRPSHGVMGELLAQGYDVIPVHPRERTVHGRTVYPDLRSIPRRIDLVVMNQGKIAGALKKLGPARGTGTTVYFHPDATIFPKIEFDGALIRERLDPGVAVRTAQGIEHLRRQPGHPHGDGPRRELRPDLARGQGHAIAPAADRPLFSSNGSGPGRRASTAARSSRSLPPG